MSGVAERALLRWGEPSRQRIRNCRLLPRRSPLPDKVGSGTAALDRTRNGGDVLTVDVSKVQPSSAGFLEVWLLAPDAKKMVSLGNLLGNRTTFTLPAGLDVADYPLVDISIEPYDGNPLHSGNSIVRGQLDVS